MFTVKGNPILVSETEVLEELRRQLALNGLNRFQHIKPGPKDIQFTCPNPEHASGQEKKPSCGVSTVEKNGTPAGTVHCFTCGYTATLPEMISFCFNYDDSGKFGESWLTKNFLTVSVENRKPLQLNLSRGAKKEEVQQFVSEEELAKYRFYHPYMYKRGLTDEIIEQFDIGYDKATRCITFPVRDKDGNCLFVARRSVVSKFFQYPDGVLKPLYGVEFITPDIKEVIICESFFNTLTCWVYGKPSIALLGLGNEQQYEDLIKLPARKYILALDPDSAGRVATQKLRRRLSRYKVISEYVIPPRCDVNDLTKEEFDNLPEVY